jgi:hypothetical protein
METDDATEKLNALAADLEEDIAKQQAECVDIDKEMAGLKVHLYAKFGKTINLELDPEE